MTQKNDIQKTIRDAAPYLGLGVQLAATVVIFVLIGDWIDTKSETKPLFLTVFSLFGISIGIYTLIKTVLELEKRKKNEK
ncbi:MAG: AtpZ/AtpI family protein [Ignavibacteriales bacterium]|nr:AtpZ/AtpI family protein [Ignavibacteriaceae bacterium]NLH61902.1 AtpZ/AtpI family protein [Ignavibacteriales bacterium]HOJ17895.1 AtpZ/AtpI family protein [Ignavibacteriaceae bacterium]HPO56327.1 AtpZ/AtpI family protein [Ignavibacteriaceae bacterium]